MPHSTLVRYIGGKSALIHEIAPFLQVPYTGVYCEPFLGGGSVALAIASTTAYAKVQFVLNDFDPEVANFWNRVINPNKGEVTSLLDQIKACQPSLELHAWMKAWNPTDPDERAFRFLFLNRTSHVASHGKRPLGGRKQANPDSDIASRFKVDNIIPEFTRARRVLMGRSIVLCKDFGDVIAEAKSNWVIYADPPYYDRNLYDVSFSPEDHVRLRDQLMTTPADWVLSYQEHSAVLELYQNATIHTMPANHSMTKRKRNELIIVPSR